MHRSGLIPYWLWVTCSKHAVVTAVMQDIQVLVVIVAPQHWPRPVWNRRRGQGANSIMEVLGSKINHSLPEGHVKEGGESTHGLVFG